MSSLTIFTFGPGFGLPTLGPFALKLLAWLNLAEIPYRQEIQDDPRKGPAGKSPWIELDGRRIADSEIIIETLEREFGFQIDAHLAPEQKAEALAWRRMFEEHFHQVLEWELFATPEGLAYMNAEAKRQQPWMGGLIAPLVKRHFQKQLHARGVSRNGPERVTAVGRADLDALAARLRPGQRFLFADRPSSADVAIFGLLMPMAAWTMRTPVAEDLKARPDLLAYLARMRQSARI